MEDTLVFATGMLVLLSAGELAVSAISILDFYAVKIPKDISLKEHRRRIVNIRTIIVPGVVTLMAGFLVNISSSLFMESGGDGGANSLWAYLYLIIAFALLIGALTLFLRDSLDIGAIATDPASIKWASESSPADSDDAETNHYDLTTNLLEWKARRTQYTFGKKPTAKAAVRARRSIENIASDLTTDASGKLPGLATAIKEGKHRTLRTYFNAYRVRAPFPVLLATATCLAILCLAEIWGAEYSLSSWKSIVFVLAVAATSMIPAACYYAITTAIAFRTIVRDEILLDAAGRALRGFKARIDQYAVDRQARGADFETGAKPLTELVKLTHNLSKRIDEIHEITKGLSKENADPCTSRACRSARGVIFRIRGIMSRRA